MQRMVVHMTLENGLSLFASLAEERFSANLQEQAVTHAVQQGCCLHARSASGDVWAILRLEHQRMKDKRSFCENCIHCVI